MNRVKKVQQAWGLFPVVECKGKCQNVCGMVRASPSEIHLLKDYCKKNGIKYVNLNRATEEKLKVILANPGTPHPDLLCEYLKNGKCTVYEVRPSICRLYGSPSDLVCPHGCNVVGGLIKPEQAFKLLNQPILQISEQDTKRALSRRRLG